MHDLSGWNTDCAAALSICHAAIAECSNFFFLMIRRPPRSTPTWISSTWPRSTTPPTRGRSARRTIDHRPPAGAAEAAPTRTQAAGVASTATGPHPLGSTPEPRMDPSQNPNVFHATTIVSVRRNGHVVVAGDRSEEHTSELQSLMRNTYAV